MNKLTKTIQVRAYMDGKEPCCEFSLHDKEVCQFYRTEGLGRIETCFFDDFGNGLRRRDDGLGTLIPLECCPIWGKVDA